MVFTLQTVFVWGKHASMNRVRIVVCLRHRLAGWSPGEPEALCRLTVITFVCVLRSSISVVQRFESKTFTCRFYRAKLEKRCHIFQVSLLRIMSFS